VNQSNKTRRAVIVGAGSGMGQASAIRLHQDGYALVLADIGLSRLEPLAARLGAQAVEVDVTSDLQVRALAQRCGAGVDALVISAGLSMSMGPFERIIQVNLQGTARVLDAFAPLMNCGGAAVCFASIAGHLAPSFGKAVEDALSDALSPALVKRLLEALPADQRNPGMAYSLSKLGILKLVQRAGVAWGRRGARVCSVSPGLIDTPMGVLERKSSPDAEAAIGAAPIPRVGTAAELANVVAFLCSEQASYITACDLLVDGGWVGSIRAAAEDSPLAQALAAGRKKS
jgi:NAD(P)-dependent dehydrogenase (short-subunit alcohol dehydrogenase family)